MEEWVDLDRRRAGLPAETDLVEGVPSHLYGPLYGWTLKRLHEGKNTYWDRVQLQAGVSLYSAYGEDLLTVVDVVLYWYPRMPPAERQSWASPTPWLDHVAHLEQILTLGRSAWRVNTGKDGLERRIEPTVTAAAQVTVAAASPAGQDHLQAAWTAAYGRRPDPDKAFHEAIRAVEDVACPLVEPASAAAGKSTLGSVIGDLRRNSFRKWELLIPSGNGRPQDIDPLLGMLELLWHSQLSRHAGAPKSRRQNQAEAEAVVHLAVILTHWLTTGVLRPKTFS